MNRRGFTLIELMITVAIVGIGMHTWDQIDHLNRMTREQRLREALVRAVDNEIERAVACEDQRCLARWAAEPASADTESWARADVRRQIGAGPEGTRRVTVSAAIPGVARRIEASRLVWVAR